MEIGSAPWQAQLFRVRDNKKLSFQVYLSYPNVCYAFSGFYDKNVQGDHGGQRLGFMKKVNET